MPTNRNAGEIIKKLLDAGVPGTKILHVMGEQHASTTSIQDEKYRTVRVTRYIEADEIQVVVATPAVMARLAAGKKKEHTLFMRPPLVVIVSPNIVI